MFRKKVRKKKRHFIASAFTIVAEHFEIGVLGTDLLCNEGEGVELLDSKAALKS